MGAVIARTFHCSALLLLLKRAATMITPRILLLLLAPSSLLGLQMDLYYESLSPDSTRFISNQIPEMWAALKEEVSINFVPYGFATTTEDENGELQFECQHGERECAGNIVQACTLYLTKDSPADQVYLITCMMSASSPDTAGPDCWLELELDYALVEECIADGLGDVLHAANGAETTAVANPPVTNVPWSNFDGEHLEGGDYWEIEEVGLLRFLCEKFTLAGCPPTQY